MRIDVGELRNDLVTNSAIVGQTQAAISGQTIIELSFFNYLLQPLVPTSLRVMSDAGAFDVNQEVSQHYIGTAGEDNTKIYGRWITEGNKMRVTGSNVQSQLVINNAYANRLTNFNTETQQYVKFKFID